MQPCSARARSARVVLFRSRVAAAAAGGFDHLSLWGRDYQDARNEGLSDRDLRIILDDHGVTLAELDPAWWWLPGAADVHIAPEHDTERIFAFGEAELFAVADALGARSLNAVDVFGGPWSLDDAAESFAALCRRAAEHGLLVQLEFLPWSKIPDLEAAWSVVREAGEPNGGLTSTPGTTSAAGRRPGARCAACQASASSGYSCATRRPWPRRIPCTPRCTNACCPGKASSTWPV